MEKSLQEIQDDLFVARSLRKKANKEATLYYMNNRIDENDHSVRLPSELKEKLDNLLTEIHVLFEQEQKIISIWKK